MLLYRQFGVDVSIELDSLQGFVALRVLFGLALLDACMILDSVLKVVPNFFPLQTCRWRNLCFLFRVDLCSFATVFLVEMACSVDCGV